MAKPKTPKTRNERVVAAWFAGKEKSYEASMLHTDGFTLYSYSTAIAYHEPYLKEYDQEEPYKVYANYTHYTSTTVKHQAALRAHLREHGKDVEIITVNMMPWRIAGYELKRHALAANPQKLVDLQDVARSVVIKAAELGHNLQPFTLDEHSINYGVYARCPDCGHGVQLVSVRLYDKWSLANRHFKVKGNAVRYKCSKRLKWQAEQAAISEENERSMYVTPVEWGG